MCELEEKPEWIHVEMSLKILADIVLLGFSNVRKSTFISVISNAKLKIINYEFTTLILQFWQVKHNVVDYVVINFPGLIEDTSKGKEMSHEFSKHPSKTKLILYMLDDIK